MCSLLFLVYVHVHHSCLALLYIAISVGKRNSQTTRKGGNISKNMILTVVSIFSYSKIVL